MAKVCVIGAGISGLVTAKTLKIRGHEVTVLERRRNLGGVWDPDFSYPEVGTQTNGTQYSYSDFPMPAEYPEWPDGAQMFAYLTEYATRFGVLGDIEFGSDVQTLRFDEQRRVWEVTVDDGTSSETRDFDYVAICTGVFNRPNVPALEGREEFETGGGVVAHTSQVTNAEMLDGKRVVVVGFQKSATDVVAVSRKRAASTTLLYRRALWKTPRFIVGKINVKYLFYSRAVEAMFEPVHPRRAERIIHSVFKPAVWVFWRAVERLLRVQLSLGDAGLVPDHPLDSQVSCALSVAPDDYYEGVRNGEVTARKGVTERFTPEGLQLVGGEVIPADVVVFGTGWVQSLPFFDAETVSKVVDENGYFRLYRNIVSPELPQLGFVGYNGSLFCQLTSEVGAAWLANLWEDGFALPSAAQMRADVAHRVDWLARKRPTDLRSFRNACVSPFEYHYWDELLTDMGLPTTRTRNWLVETFKPLAPSDYAELLQPVRAPRTDPPGPPSNSELTERAA
jgi:dimethylaniline monooxygenase (N-oxide forming)